MHLLAGVRQLAPVVTADSAAPDYRNLHWNATNKKGTPVLTQGAFKKCGKRLEFKL